MAKISREVRRAREAMGLSPNEYAKRVGLSRQAIVKIEEGGDCTATTLERLVKKGGLQWTENGPKAAVAA